ncbi:glycosyltransferase [Deinococcus sp. MIMF12]|uniref:Glycosyltransferase n=1 Tax=Deinococcus rhizophilus TaxID=3049544 RepID=A0ABT7JD94_9DEIO|nr:glycosyltransferase [Deinococcus rhizophilus]MDL2343002.1 glycosyltransferase [Deinococcus rhizophilus]
MRVLHLTTAHSDDDIRINVKEAISLAENHYVGLIAPRRSEKLHTSVDYFPLRTAKTRLGRIKLQTEVLRLVKRFGPDVVHFHDPELLFLGLYLRKLGYKVIWDVHEDLPKQMQRKSWIPIVLRKPGAKLVSLIEKRAAPYFSGIITATPSINRNFEGLNKTAIVRNYPKLGEIRDARLATRNPKFIYAGGITTSRGINEIISSIDILSRTHSCELLLAGMFESKDLENRVAEHGSVNNLGWLKRDDLLDVYERCVAGLVVVHPAPNHLEGLPTKMFEYMAAGLPFIASNFPIWQEIVKDYECGILVDPFKPAEIARAMAWILDNPDEARDMGLRGQEAIRTVLNWEAESKTLIEFYRELEEL